MTSWRIEAQDGLTPGRYQDALRLQVACEAAEGLDLKLELHREGTGSAENTFLAYSGDLLVGYCGIDIGHEAEVCGMVHPDHRRQGIGTALLEAVVATTAAAGRQSFLVIAEEASPVALDWMTRRGAVLDQTELRMMLDLASLPPQTKEATTRLRPVAGRDQAELLRLLSGAFPDAAAFVNRPRHPGEDNEETLLAYEGNSLVGTTRILTTPKRSMIYGFVIDRAMRGRGHGRAMMRAVLDRLSERGFTQVGLEVDADNTPAVRLYTRFGFRVITTYRYMRLAV